MAVSFLHITAAVLVLAGLQQHSTQFEYSGAVTIVLPDSEQIREFSVYEHAEGMSHTGNDNDAGIRVLQASFYCLVIIAPLLHILLSLLLWHAKLFTQQRESMLVAVQILFAWSALDVFVVGSAVAVLQISQVVKFMIGDKCSQIDRLLGSIGLPDECFEVDASLQSGYGLLASGVVLAFLAQMIVVSLAKQTLKQDGSSESEEHRNAHGCLEACCARCTRSMVEMAHRIGLLEEMKRIESLSLQEQRSPAVANESIVYVK